MKKLVIVILFLTSITSCFNSEKPKKPENLISKDKMVDILIDVSLINAAKGINKSILEENNMVPDNYIYTKHKIDSLQFVSSNAYYAYYIKDYQGIINKINDSLKKLRNRYSILVEKEADEKKKADSIKRSKRKNKGFIKEEVMEAKSLKNN